MITHRTNELNEIVKYTDNNTTKFEKVLSQTSNVFTSMHQKQTEEERMHMHAQYTGREATQRPSE